MVGTITQAVRVSLNDAAGNVFTDAVLLPFFNLAYNDMGSELENNGDETFIEDEAFLTVPAISGSDPSAQVIVSDTAIVIAQAGNVSTFLNPAEAANPANFLPVDLYRPMRLQERMGGSSDNFVDMTDRTSKGGLPSWGQGSTSLIYWEWREDGLCFTGATSDVQLRLRYQKMLLAVSDPTASIAVRNGQNYLTFQTAYLAARSKGSPRAAEFKGDADESLHKMLVAVARTQKPFRRRPHSSRRGVCI